MIGTQVSHYRIMSLLGAGGMGEVFRAEDTRLGRHVALKFLSSELLQEADARRRFEFEARTAAILNHPHITTLYEFDAEGGFMSLELVEGETLEQRLAGRSLEPGEALRVALAVCRALGHAHSRNVVHRDIKPSNILLGSNGAIKLTDFGLAKMRDVSLRTSANAMLGTLGYMCPEQINGRGMDRRGDLFSLGVVLYRALSGRLPWSGEGLAVFYSVLHDTPPALAQVCPSLAPAWSHVVGRLMRKEPEDRFASAEELEAHLLELESSLVPPSPARSGRRAAAPVAERSTPGAAEFPTRPGTRPRALVPLVGREAELAALHAALEEARLGAGRTILLAGEAGVGKSRLMEEFRGYAESRGALCLRGHCSLSGGRNFEPFVEALEEYARGAMANARAGTVEGGAGPELPAAVLPTLNLLLDPQTALGAEPRSREQLWWLLDSLLKSIAASEPLTILLDDLHWADEGALALLHHVTRNIGRSRLLLLGSFRPEELTAGDGREHPLADLLRLLSPLETCRSMTLAPLDARGSGALLQAALDDALLGDELARAVFGRAQGNPFFTLEIVRLLADVPRHEGSGRSRPGPDTLGIPQTVSDVVLRRMMRLTPEDRELLEVAAVEGEVFRTDTLEQGTGLARMVLLKRLRALQQTHQLILPTDEGYRFSHGLIREVVLREIPQELRREYHGVVARHLLNGYAERADYSAQIGGHLFEARQFAEALPYLLRAAAEARRLFLNDRAREFLDQALEAQAQAGGDPAQRSAVQRQRCEVLLLVGRLERAREAADEALELDRSRGDPPAEAASLELVGEAALAQGDLAAAERALSEARDRYLALADDRHVARCDQKLGSLAARRGDFDDALRRLNAALEGLGRAGDDRGAVLIRLDAGDALYRRGDYARAQEDFETAIADLRRLDDRHALARGLNLLGNVVFHRGHTDEALTRYQEALELAVELGDLRGMARLQANLGNVHLVRGDAEPALRSYRQALARFEEIGDQVGTGQILVALGNVCFTRGDFEDAADYYRRSVGSREQMGDRWGLANSLDNLGVAEYFLGHWDVSLEHARAALELRRELNDRLGCIESALNLGNLMAVLGDPSAAERSYSEASRGAAELGDPRKAARALLSRACLRLSAGDHPGVNQLLATFRDLGIEEPSLRARRLLLEGLSTRGTGGADPESLLREALAEAVRAGSVPEQASVRLALARTCRAAARWEEARGHIQEALILVGAGRVPLLELEAMRLAAALGADMTPPLGSDPAATERVRALRAALAEPVPTELKGHANFEHPLFPLP